ncbi:MAG: metallophosphoesterase family protein [Sphingobacteriales bacterium]|nr:MAG: metallophosphoesterase family protein [Sphingobacteriales bacterium]
MKKIGIISDTHSFLDQQVFQYFKDVDEIWHAGDIGNLELTNEIEKHKKLRAVFGNIDSHVVRAVFPKHEIIQIEGCIILMIHIAGAFGKYNDETKKLILEHKPDILVCGHSHIVKIAFDQKYNLLYINTGAAGKHGFHKMRTILRFELNDGKPQNMELIELGSRAAIS